jgi:hypothetical protein
MNFAIEGGAPQVFDGFGIQAPRRLRFAFRLVHGGVGGAVDHGSRAQGVKDFRDATRVGNVAFGAVDPGGARSQAPQQGLAKHPQVAHHQDFTGWRGFRHAIDSFVI